MVTDVREDMDGYAGQMFLKEQRDVIGRHFGLSTVSLGAVLRGDVRGPPSTVFSGVLVELFGRAFILTAGHCVEDVGERLIVETGGRGQCTNFRPYVAGKNYRYDADTSGFDHGYIELAEHDSRTMEANAKLFLKPSQIDVVLSSELQNEGDWMCLSGYPIEFYRDIDAGVAIRMLHVSGRPTGCEDSPVSLLKPGREQVNSLDIAVPAGLHVGNTEDDPPTRVRLPPLEGASGGGLWRMRTRTREGWSAKSVALVGTLSSGSPTTFDDTVDWFYRCSLLSHHLRLIADDYDDLRKQLLDRWSLLAFV